MRAYVRRKSGELVIAPLVGIVVGLAMEAVRLLVFDLLLASRVALGGPLVVLAPIIGLTSSALVLRWFASDPAMHDTEAYIAAYHSGRGESRFASVLAKAAAAIATVGSGGAAGLEGPAVHIGSSLAERVQVPLHVLGIRLGDRRALLACGAAAGIAAIFKTPLTGVLFALEVPYQDEIARESLIPALLSSVSAYLVAVAVSGPEPLFPVARRAFADVRTLLLALALGLLIGLAGRGFVAVLRISQAVSERITPPLVVRAMGGGVVCAAAGHASSLLLGAPLALGSGYAAIEATSTGAVEGPSAVWLLILRSIAVLATLGSGVAGGSFLPLLSLGAIAGAAVAPLLPGTASLLPVIGMAAFLSAGYGVPLTAAVFVAESTGAPGYVIPGLVAAAIAYTVSGGHTLSHLQRRGDAARLRDSLQRPVSTLMTSEVISTDAETSVETFVSAYVVRHRRKSFPVTRDGRLVGMVSLGDVQPVAERDWPVTPVSAVMHLDLLTAGPDETAADVLVRMEENGIDRMPVTDASGEMLGIVSISDLVPPVIAG